MLFRISRIALAVLSMSLLANAAQAQSEVSEGWYIAPTLNVFQPDKDWNPDKSKAGFGLKLGIPLSSNFDLQLGGSTARTRQNGASYRQSLIGLDGVYLFGTPGLGLRPLVLAGFGVERDSSFATGPVGGTKTSPYLNAGLGLRYQFSPQWALQGDFRHVRGYMKDAGKTKFGFDNSNNKYLTLALNYAFDAPVAPAPAPEPAPAPAPEPAPAPAAVEPPPPPPPAPKMEKVTLSATELFAFNKANLRMPQPKLDELAAALQANAGISTVVITGYTDRLGSVAYNNRLSKRRAESVKKYLVSKGVAAERIQAMGKGKSQPVKECKERRRSKLIMCLEPNRRIEVEPVSYERTVQ
jgi:OmpA-OmpF porin, OOP family